MDSQSHMDHMHDSFVSMNSAAASDSQVMAAAMHAQAMAVAQQHQHQMSLQQQTVGTVAATNSTAGAGAGEKRAPRMRFSQEASDRLYALYKAGVSKPNKQLREELARELGKTPRSIQIWFQNRRAKAKQVFAQQQHGMDLSDDESPLGYGKRKQQSLSLNMNALSGSHMSASPKSAHGQYFVSPYSAASYANHMQNRNSPSIQRRLSIDNIMSAPYSPVQRKASAAQLSPQQMRSASIGGMYHHQRSPQGSMQSPISHLLCNDTPSFGDMMKSNNAETNASTESAYPSPQEMQYGRSLKNAFPGGLGKLETSHLPSHGSASFPQSAVEMGRSSSITGTLYHEPQSAVTYGGGGNSSPFNFDNIPSSSDSYSASGSEKGAGHYGSAKAKFASTLPDLHEITSDPTKFIDWLNTSNQ